MATPPGDGTSRQHAGARSIVWLHYLFAVLTLATLGASVWLTHSLAGAYHEALEEYREWEGFDERVAQLGNRLSTMEAAITELDSAQNQKLRVDDGRLAFAPVAAEFASLRSDFRAEVVWGHPTIPRLLAKLAEAEKASAHMNEAATATLSAAQAHNDDTLHAQMAAMERAERIARRKLSELHGIVQETQDLWWSRHIENLGDTSQSQLLTAFALLFVIVFGTLLGRRLQRRFARIAEGLRVAEAQRAAEARRFESFAEIASDLLWETDRDHKITYVSHGIQSFGATADTIVGRDLMQAVATRSDSAAARSIASALRYRKPFAGLTLPLHLALGPRWVSVEAVPQFDGNGTFTGFRGASRDVTKLVAAQRELQASTTRYESLSESIEGIVYRLRLDERWTVEYLSPNTERFFGVAAEQLVGQPAREIFWWIVHREDRVRHDELMSAAVAQRAPYEIEFRIKSPFGGYKYMLERGRVIDGEPGEAPILDAFMVDITEQVTAREALRESERRFQSLSSNLDGALYRSRAMEPFVDLYFSEGVEKLTGYQPGELTGPVETYFSEVVLPEDREVTAAEFARARRDRVAVEVEYRIRHKDGTIKWIYDRGAPSEIDAQGRPQFIDGILIDITARKQAEIRAAEAERRFRTLLENIDEVFFTCLADAQWSALSVSPAFERLSGYSADELLVHKTITLADLVHPDDRAHVAAVGAATNGAAYEVRYRLVTKSGDVRTVTERGRRTGSTEDGRAIVAGVIYDITAQLAAQEALRQSEERFQVMASNFDGTMFRVRLDYPIVAEYISSGIEQLVGIKAADLYGEPAIMLNLMHRDDQPAYLEKVAASLVAGTVYEAEYRVTLADGSVKWMLERGRTSVRDATGKPTHVDGFIVDITARKELERAVSERDRRFASLAGNIDGVLFRARLGRNHVMEYYSPHIKTQTGVDAKELIGKPSIGLRLMHPDDRQRYDQVLKDALKRNEQYEIEFRMVLPSGETKWILERGRAAEFDESGKPIVLEGFSLDITARKELERAVGERDRRFAAVAANFDGVIFRVRLDDELRMEYVSPGVISLWGVPQADAIGRRSATIRLMHPEDASEYLATVTSACVSGELYEAAYRLVMPDGRQRWVLERGRVSDRDGAGVPTHIDGFIVDITESKETESALAAARDAAEAASRAKSEFLAMMSHEIRTPMNGVLGMTGVLLDTELDPEQRRSAATIRESAESLLSIINDVLDFSKLEAQAMEFERVAFDLHAMLQYACEIVAPRANAKAVALSVDIDRAVPKFIFADPGRIRQVVLNLLGNAIKFTEQGSVTLQVRAGGCNRLRIAVVDTGIGIPPDRIGRLFQSFSQTDASISRRFGGTGLGLAISKKLCERMGGTIGVESVQGHGSTFWLELPIEIANAEQAETSGAGVEDEVVENALAVLRSIGRPLRLLVAEDNATNQLVARSVLAKYGIAPDFVGNGVEAIEAVRQRPYDIVLMDVHMPEMDGLDATKAIRSLKSPQASIPIVALTANAFANDVEQCRAAGMNGHVGKPFRKEELVVALANALSGRRGFDKSVQGEHQSASECQTLDLDVIDKFRADSGEEMLSMLLDTFASDAAEKLDRLAALARAGVADKEALRLAHSLKSAGAMAGAAALSEAAARLEKALSLDGAVAHVPDVQTLRAKFEGYRKELAARGLVANG
jgi:PAS domain S-box-containing protein